MVGRISVLNFSTAIVQIRAPFEYFDPLNLHRIHGTALVAIRHAIAACGYLEKSKFEFWGKIGEKIFYSNFECAVMS